MKVLRSSRVTVLAHHDPGSKLGEKVPDPSIKKDSDAVARVGATTLCAGVIPRVRT